MVESDTTATSNVVEAEAHNAQAPTGQAERDNTSPSTARAEPIEASADLGVDTSTALQTEAIEVALTTWRAQTAPTLPATQVFFIEALARRAAMHERETRQHLNQKLLQALVSFQASNAAGALALKPDGSAINRHLRLETTPAASTPHSPDAAAPSTTPEAAPPSDTAINALTALRQQLDEQATTPARTAWRTQNTTSLRATWSALHAQQRVTHALASKPPQAGPLNSEQLVHRALLMMREVSPDYLRHMVSTVDVLCWGEQLQQGGKGSVAAATTPINRSKPSRSKA
ncbi:MAG: hypothetical protein RIS44_560 [Pseudomonadota bacterium]|jgi:hypothetical protein